MRLDAYLHTKGAVNSRTRASNLIALGRVCVNDKVVYKAAYEVKEGDEVSITEDYDASLGGLKLQEALVSFGIDCRDKVCLDVGASNGGFTDVLIKNGAQSVYAVDVGVCALPDNLKNDGKVVVMDRTNARYLNADMFSVLPDLAVIDVSFISLKLILPAVFGVVKAGGCAVALIKPQFECGKKDLTKKGILNDSKKRDRILVDIEEFCTQTGWKSKGIVPAPHPFAEKNREYLICLNK